MFRTKYEDPEVRGTGRTTKQLLQLLDKALVSSDAVVFFYAPGPSSADHAMNLAAHVLEKSGVRFTASKRDGRIDFPGGSRIYFRSSPVDPYRLRGYRNLIEIYDHPIAR